MGFQSGMEHALKLLFGNFNQPELKQMVISELGIKKRKSRIMQPRHQMSQRQFRCVAAA